MDQRRWRRFLANSFDESASRLRRPLCIAVGARMTLVPSAPSAATLARHTASPPPPSRTPAGLRASSRHASIAPRTTEGSDPAFLRLCHFTHLPALLEGSPGFVPAPRLSR